jgi:hypothetical protein
MRARQAGGLGHVVDGSDELRVHLVGRVEDEQAIAVERGRPDLGAVVGVTHVVGLVAGAVDVYPAQDLAVGGRRQVDVDDGEEVGSAVGNRRQAPQVHHLFGLFQALDVRRQAGLRQRLGRWQQGHDRHGRGDRNGSCAVYDGSH